MRVSKGLKQAYQMQDLAFEAAMSLKEARTQGDGKLKLQDFDGQVISQLIKSWEIAQDRIRIHRRVPLPGSLRPEKKTKAKTPVNLAVIEPMPGRSDEEPEAGQSAG